MTRLFGTNGIRGIVGPEMNADLALKVGRAIGTSFGGGTVVLGRDTRLSGPMLARAAASGLMSAGCDVIDLGVVPTPCEQYFLAKSGHLKGGVVVTASHNPREFNGIKALDARGMEMRREDEEAIESIFFDGTFHVAAWSEVGSIRSDDGANHQYLEAILAKVDVAATRKSAFTVVVDPGNGAGCVVTPYLLRSLGCRVISLNGQPDGAFPGRMPEPIPDHLGDLMRVVSEVHADLGIAHDGDADRAIFVDDKGSFVYGDKSLALLAKAAIQGRGGTVVTPVSTSSLIDEVVRAAGGRVVRTRVGSPIVARTMFETGAAFGGEENGGVIFPDHQFCRDGAMSAAKMLELLAHEGKRLSSLTAALPQYHLKKSNVSVPVERREAVLSSLVELTKGRKVDTTDGVKIVEADGAVLVRPSGTEPIFRVYAEGRTPERAEALAREGADLIEKALGRRLLAGGNQDDVRQDRAERGRDQVHGLLVHDASAFQGGAQHAVDLTAEETDGHRDQQVPRRFGHRRDAREVPPSKKIRKEEPAGDGCVGRRSERTQLAKPRDAAVGAGWHGLTGCNEDRLPGEHSNLAREGVRARDGQGGEEDDAADDLRETCGHREGDRRDRHGGESVREHVRRLPFASDPLLDAQRLLQGEPVAGGEEAREKEEQQEEQPGHVAEDPDDHADDERRQAAVPRQYVAPVREGAQGPRQDRADEDRGHEIQRHWPGKSRSGYSLSDPVLGPCLPGVEGALFLLRPSASELLERRVDSIRREVVFVAEHVAHPVGIRIAESQFDGRKDVRFQEDFPHLVLRFNVDVEFLEGRLEGPVFLHERQGLLRPDPLDAFVEVRADQQAHVDELLARDAEVRQRGLQRDLLRLDVDVDLLPRQLPPASNREVLHEPRRAEQ